MRLTSIAFLESKGRSGHCPHCNTWLGLSANTAFSTCSVREDEELWKEWVTKAIGEMLTAAPTISRPPKKEHFSHTLERYIELILKGNTALLARQLCLHSTTVKDWQNGRQLPQLGSLLKVCHYLGTSPLHLLSKDDVIMPHKFPSLPTKLTVTGKNKNTYRPIDDELLRQELEKELTSQDQPPRSKGQILKLLGYNPSTATKHFPELCRKVSARYRAYQKNKHSENMQDMINDIKRATYKVHAQGEYPRIVRVSEFLRRPKTVRIPEVNAAWHQALQELGLEVKNPTESYPSDKDAPNDFTEGEPETKESLGNDSRKRHKTVENELSSGMRKNSNDPVTSCRREPIGIGTFYTESLTSFVSRLACAHGMSVSDFVIELLASSEGGLFLLSRKNGHSLSDLWKDAAGLNGTSTSINEWFQALEYNSNSYDLCFLTMMTWNDVLVQKDLVHHYRAWCPLCFERWSAEGSTVYEPLLWLLKVVRVCPIHLQPLQIQCPRQSCQKRLPVLSPASRPGYCSECGEWLGASSQSKILAAEKWTEGERIWREWVAASVGEMIAHAPSLLTKPRREKTASMIMSCAKQVTGGNIHELGRKLELDSTLIRRWKLGYFMQLEQFLRFCFPLGISPLQFLTEEAITIDPIIIEKLVALDPPARHWVIYDKEKL